MSQAENVDPFDELEARKHSRWAIAEEIDNPTFANRLHYSKSTYSAGCRGILCTLAVSHYHKYKRFRNGLPISETLDIMQLPADRYHTRFAVAYFKIKNKPLPPHLMWRINTLGIVLDVPFDTDGMLSVKLITMYLDMNWERPPAGDYVYEIVPEYRWRTTPKFGSPEAEKRYSEEFNRKVKAGEFQVRMNEM